MTNYREWFTESQINSKLIYQDLSTEISHQLEHNLSISEILNWITKKTRQEFAKQYNKLPEVGAINNCKGRWNEFLATTLLSEITFNINQQNNACLAIFSLHNSRLNKNDSSEAASKFLSLFINNNMAYSGSLSKIAVWQNQIFLPSPDYIIVSFDNHNDYDYIQNMLLQQAKNPENLLLYEFFKGKLKPENIKATVSLKTSNRPDRRYQPLFEAAMIKAMAYLLKQNWEYYMVVNEFSNTDTIIFSQAIAPHAIALEQNLKLVDGNFLYRTKADLMPLMQRFSNNY